VVVVVVDTTLLEVGPSTAAMGCGLHASPCLQGHYHWKCHVDGTFFERPRWCCFLYAVLKFDEPVARSAFGRGDSRTHGPSAQICLDPRASGPNLSGPTGLRPKSTWIHGPPAQICLDPRASGPNLPGSMGLRPKFVWTHRPPTQICLDPWAL